MAITRSETQVTWAAANFKTVAGGTSETSDAVSLDATCVQAEITLKAEYTSGTPVADDIIYFWWLATAGDPDGTSTIEYATPPQAINESGGALLLRALDLTKGETSGSGKMIIATVPLPNVPYRGKLFAEGVTAGSTNPITVSATIEEMRAA